jgi:hypothetical protein
MTISKSQLKRIRETGSWVCVDCGLKYGRTPEGHVATYHIGKCDVCGEEKAVTEFRDYNHLRK